jgi:hypothetical protein
LAYTPREIKDRVAVGDDIFIVEDLGNNRIRLIPAPTYVSEPGTPVNKALLQPMENHMGDVANPHATTKAQVGLGNVDNVKQATKAEFDAHANLTAAHSATSTATANRIIIRDSAGRAKVAAPSASDDIARKAEVDAVSSALNTHKDATSGIHGATSSATANRLIIRDSNGRASVAGPTSASHIATKGYVDGLVGPLQAGTAFAYYLTPPDVTLDSNNTEYGSWWVQDVTRSVVVRILLPGTIRYHVQYQNYGATTYVRILQNGSQIREESTLSSSWQTVTGNIAVSPGDIIAIQKRASGDTGSARWRNVRIETAQPTLGIQRF